MTAMVGEGGEILEKEILATWRLPRFLASFSSIIFLALTVARHRHQTVPIPRRQELT